RAEPVAQCELVGVLDAHAALLRAVDEEDPAQGPVRLAAEVVAVLLVDEDDPPPGPAQLVRRDEAGKPRSPDADVPVPRHADESIHLAPSSPTDVEWSVRTRVVGHGRPLDAQLTTQRGGGGEARHGSR